ncbi:MAG: NADH-ubiquinone oxidoreductase-F iron-sulfur binding region domain-containing protein [Planctomycetota bacterium]|nr:NADH-ubiquinone oxidoreductase-F iron-sulfur binding region domain-containing protein [Planctomycetota bacterium]
MSITGGRAPKDASRREQQRRKQGELPDRLQAAGGMVPEAAAKVATATGSSEAAAFGVASFYSLLARPDKKVRVCTGLSCRMKGADEVLEAALAAGLDAEGCSCLAACDTPPAVLKDRVTLPEVTALDMAATKGDWTALASSSHRVQATATGITWTGDVGPADAAPDSLSINLLGEANYEGAGLAKAAELGAGTDDADAFFQELENSGLQGRGGAGFPAHIKWRAVAGQPVQERFVVLNADEGEPGTFKDRELMMRRPDLVIEGLAIAARAVGADTIYLYLRGEFQVPRVCLEDAIAAFEAAGLLTGLDFHIHEGQGSYICGEETALLEALEGKRGMPRLKPPFPVEVGLWGKPTLIHNVETIACVPGILARGGAAFRAQGRDEAGAKLYCVSGHVARPGTYELPLGVTLDELVEAAGGYVGELKAFCPGGASAGFLPASERTRPLDYKSLGEVGSMLGSAGVVVLNDTVDMRWACLEQLRFFEDESCGQCAPCRIGTRYLREAVDRDVAGTCQSNGDRALTHVDDVAWQMGEGSICGLGQIAALPLTSARKYFPGDFQD